MRAKISASAIALAAALGAAGCGPYQHTHAVIEIKTDFDCAALTDVVIDLIGSQGNQTTAAQTSQCSNGRVGSLVFLPPDSFDSDSDSTATGEQLDGHFFVTVTAGVEIAASECEANGFFGCIVARRRLAFDSTPVEILLTEDCLHEPCSKGVTCVSGGECGPINIDYASCDDVCDESNLTSEIDGS
jgi:hypothetical protein